MLGLRPFQIVLFAIFGVLAVVAVLLLSGFSPSRSAEEQAYGPRVVIWGTLSSRAFKDVIEEASKGDKGFDVVSYQQVDIRTFNDELVNAIAEGRSPDLIVLPHSQLVTHRSKLLAIPYNTISERTFRDTYVDGAEIFMLPDGVYAVPFGVNPLMMYWNRDMFSSAGFAQAPTTWEYITNTLVPRLTIRDNNRNVIASTLAFGEFRNIFHAKEMLITLAMQSGSQLIYEERDRYVVNLDVSAVDDTRPLTSSVQFFTNFSNSNSALYSWNRIQPEDRNAFIAGDLALYFGYGSENATLKDLNPNLNFDIAPMPQGSGATTRRTYGEFFGFAIPRASTNSQGAFGVAQVLASAEGSKRLTEALNIASAHRSVIAQGSQDPFRQVILSSALISRGWLDPGPEESNEIFQIMIEDITSGRARVNEAVQDAVERIRLAL